MRNSKSAVLLLLPIVAACRVDRATAPAPHPPGANASLNLGTIGATPLYQSEAVAINDSGVILGRAQLTPGDRYRIVEWRPPDYQLTVLPDDGPGFTQAFAISRDGTVAGSACDSIGQNCRPIYWRDSVLHHLDGFGAVKDVCSCDGHTLVGRITVNGHDHAAIWEDDILIDIGIPDDRHSAELVGVAHGFIIGMSYQNTEETGTTQRRTYRWSPTTAWVQIGSEEGIYDVNARGSVVGGFGEIWPDGSNVPEALGGQGLGGSINDSDVVAGGCVPDPDVPDKPFLPCEWTRDRGWFAIGDELNANVNGINNADMAVGSIYDPVANRSYAMLWRP